MSAERDCSHIYAPALLSQLSSHGRSLTSSRLLKTVSADRREERGVNTLAPHKPSRSLNNTLQMETRGCLLGRLIIGVVWLLAGASWLHFLTSISETPGSASSRRLARSAGSLLSRPFTSFIMLDLYFTLISAFSASAASPCTPHPPRLRRRLPTWGGRRKKELILSKYNEGRTRGSLL